MHWFCGDGYCSYTDRKLCKLERKTEDFRYSDSSGGDAVNQSIHLADFRVDTALCACTGDDSTGQMLRAALQERNVDVSFVRSKEGIRTGTAMVLINPEGERHIFSVQGAHSTLCAEDLPKVLPEDCRAISLASLFSMPELEWNGLLPYLQTVHHQNIRVFADLAADKQGLGLAGIEPFLPEIDYFLPSLYDVLNMTGTETAEEAARVFRNLGSDHVIIKCGSEGCYCSDKHFSGWISAIPVRPVDTTGAELVCPLHLSIEFWKGIPWRTLADMPAQQVLTVHCLSVLPRQS